MNMARTRKGDVSISMFIMILIGLAVLALVIYLLVFKLRPNGEQLASLQGCSTVLGDGGRCFATSDCGGGNGWTLIAKIGCTGANKYCCRLSDPDKYYPAGTLLLETTVPGSAPLSATYRVVADASGKTSLNFETGDKGTENYNATGIPKKAMLYFKYKVKADENHCALQAGGSVTPAPCTADTFFTFSTVPSDYNSLTKGNTAVCNQQSTCSVTIHVLTANATGRKPDLTFQLPFQK